MRPGAAILLAVALSQWPLVGSAQPTRLWVQRNVVHVEATEGTVDVEMPCGVTRWIGVADRFYIATTCGVARLELSSEGVRRVHRMLDGQRVTNIWVTGNRIEAQLVTGEVRLVEEVSRLGEFEDPSRSAQQAQLAERGVPLYLRIGGPPGPRIMDPPRQADRWELAASAFVFIATPTPGVGAMLRSSVIYRGTAPFSLRADLMPLALASGGATASGAFGMLWGAFDAPMVEAGLGVGILSNNEHPNVGPFGGTATNLNMSGQLAALGASLRIGYADGVNLLLRTGLGIADTVDFGFFEANAQIPFSLEGAVRFGFAYSKSGNIEARAGLRWWLNGSGAAGSLALTIDLGYARVHYVPPDRPRGYPDAAELGGPAAGVGIEARL